MKQFSSYRDAATEIHTDHTVTIGNFDGVHSGHRALLQAARRAADAAGLPLAVLTFTPHPSAVLRPETARPSLSDPEQKSALLAAEGADIAVFQKFDAEFAAFSPEQFVETVLLQAFRARRVVVGENFRFGAQRAADVRVLSDLGKHRGFDVQAEPLVKIDDILVSSSQIRSLLTAGDVRGAARLLGRPYEVSGRVVGDRQQGRTFGFPTVNLSEVQVMLPRNGIYAARVSIENDVHPAAVYIGTRPTQSAGFSVEAHLLDFDGDLYGRRVRIHFVDWVRGDMKFEDTTALIRQIHADVAAVRKMLEQPA